MLALRELQTRFANALFDGATDHVQADVVANGVSAAERVEIYRNNLREGFIKALAITFPVIERLVGTDYFRHLASEYHRAHPSRSGNLDHVGAVFAAFLRAHFATTEYAYLPDVAQLEWACHQALVAPDAVGLTAEIFRDIEPEHVEQARFDLHPAAMVVRSGYPILRIWRANQDGATDEALIDLAAGGDDVLVHRTTEGVTFHRLPPADLAVLDAFAAGSTLGAALEAGQSVAPEFDLGATLQRLLALSLLVQLHLPDASIPRISQ